MDQNNQVYDLRSALNLLRSQPGQLVETDVPVDPSAELAGVYRHVGAGGTVQRPTREGPAMLFHQIHSVHNFLKYALSTTVIVCLCISFYRQCER